ncbi:MAG: hypothetical protein WBH99_00820 [Azovibrio sp.]|uniref:hypothetical protein n=1 Tax=Azovibrio sp. TaxID=1872673 RepID=UPI003C75B257
MQQFKVSAKLFDPVERLEALTVMLERDREVLMEIVEYQGEDKGILCLQRTALLELSNIQHEMGMYKRAIQRGVERGICHA